jgi:uncharacterized membrane protein YobD (UPF0266 family)
MKIFNVLMVVGIIIFILFTAYSYFKMNRGSGKRR